LGITTVLCTALDASGNSNSCTFTVTVRDLEPPTIICPQDVVYYTDLGTCAKSNVTYTARATDNCTNVTIQCQPPSGSTFGVGAWTVTCTATDGAGNTASCNFTVTVKDTEAPHIICPSNMCVMGYAPTGAVVFYPPPQVADNCAVSLTNCVPPSGSLFPPGVTIVTCTAIDVSGNSSSCNFVVRVAPPCPKLQISLQGSEIWICWQNDNSGCTLQYTDSLTQPIVWTPWPGPVFVTSDGLKCTIIRNYSGARFFRLYGPCSITGP